MRRRKWLVNIRKQKQLTQSQVAEKSGISKVFYAQVESGIRNPSIHTAQRIGKVLEFDWTLFFLYK